MIDAELRWVAAGLAMAFCGVPTRAAPPPPPPPAQAAALNTYIAVYRRGPAFKAGVPIFEQPTVREHIAHHEALGERLIAAGPVRPGADDLVGFVVFRAADQASADRWFRADPAIAGGVMRGEVRQWGVSTIKAVEARPR